jgi:hypothetical protein
MQLSHSLQSKRLVSNPRKAPGFNPRKAPGLGFLAWKSSAWFQPSESAWFQPSESAWSRVYIAWKSSAWFKVCIQIQLVHRYDPVKTIKTSVMGTLNMLGLAKRIGARFLLTSTSEAGLGYGLSPRSRNRSRSNRSTAVMLLPRDAYNAS